MPFNAPQPTRTSQTPTHTPTTARAIAAHGTITRACEGRARVAVIPYRVAIPARAANAHAYASAHSACHAHAHTAPPTYAYARAQKPRRMAAIPVIAAEGVHVPAYAGCISRLLAPKVARPSRRQSRRSSSTRRQAVAFRTPLASPRRRKARPNLPQILGGMVCLTPWLRQPASGLPTQLRVPAAQSPSAPLQARCGRSRSLRGLSAGSASPLRGLAPQGREEREERTIHARQPALLHIRSRIC